MLGPGFDSPRLHWKRRRSVEASKRRSVLTLLHFGDSIARPQPDNSMTDAAPVTEAKASSDIPIVSDALRVLRVPFSPGAVFSEMEAKPAWFVPWLMITLLCCLIGILTLPYTERIMDL